MRIERRTGGGVGVIMFGECVDELIDLMTAGETVSKYLDHNYVTSSSSEGAVERNERKDNK